MSKYELNYLKTCALDYFCGAHVPYVQIKVDERTTYSLIKESLMDYFTYYHLLEYSYFDDGFDYSLYVQAIEEWFSHIKDPQTIPTDLLGIGIIDDEDFWNVYMYFTIRVIY